MAPVYFSLNCGYGVGGLGKNTFLPNSVVYFVKSIFLECTSNFFVQMI